MTDIATLEYYDAETGDVSLRNAVLLVFFINRPVDEISLQLIAIVDMYLQAVPADALKWSVVGATSESWREVNDKTISKCKALLAPEGAKKRKLTAFHLSDCTDGASRYSIHLIGKTKNPDFPDAQTMLQMSFPIEAIHAAHVEKLVSLIRLMCQTIDFTSGYCAPALMYSDFFRGVQTYMELRGLCMRHPGYDVHNNRVTQLRLGNMSRGARWISMLGAPLLSRLGGFDTVKSQLPVPITVEKFGGGCMIRAGTLPEIGDVNRREPTPLLREVAKVMEPVTYFGERKLIFSSYETDDSFLNRWERRFFD